MAQAEQPKCPNCKGWAFEPDHYPLKACTTCGGTGRRAQQQRLAQ